MRTNKKMLLVPAISWIMLVSASASAHMCEFPKENKACNGKTIVDDKCKVKMSKKDCENKGGTFMKKMKK